MEPLLLVALEDSNRAEISQPSPGESTSSPSGTAPHSTEMTAPSSDVGTLGSSKQAATVEDTTSTDESSSSSSSPTPAVVIWQDDIHDKDVLSGRGGGTNVHPGNRHFRNLIEQYRISYLKARKNDKPDISRSIVASIRSAGGRFLKKKGSGWVDIGDAAAREKTSQALRQRAPEIRKRMFMEAAGAARQEPSPVSVVPPEQSSAPPSHEHAAAPVAHPPPSSLVPAPGPASVLAPPGTAVAAAPATSHHHHQHPHIIMMAPGHPPPPPGTPMVISNLGLHPAHAHHHAHPHAHAPASSSAAGAAVHHHHPGATMAIPVRAGHPVEAGTAVSALPAPASPLAAPHHHPHHVNVVVASPVHHPTAPGGATAYYHHYTYPV